MNLKNSEQSVQYCSVIRQKTPFRKMSILWWPHDSPVRPSHFGRRTQEFYTCSLLSCQPWLVGIKVDNSKENRHKILEFIFQNGMVQQVNQVCLDRIWPLKKKQSQICKSDFLHFQQADRQSSAQLKRLI